MGLRRTYRGSYVRQFRGIGLPLAVLVLLTSCANQNKTNWSTALPTATGGGILPYLIGVALDEAFKDTSKPKYLESTDLPKVCAAGREGDGAALSSVAWHYRNGWPPVAKDLTEAYKWFILAEAAGYEAAAQYRVDLASTMPAADISEAARRAEAWSPTEEACSFVVETAAQNPPAAQPLPVAEPER